MLFLVWLGVPLSCFVFRNKNIQDGSKMALAIVLAVLFILKILLGG